VFATNEIIVGRMKWMALARSANAMCCIIVTKNLLSFRVPLWKEAIRIRVSPMRDERSPNKK
jgi:hypothetical protein